MNKRRIFITLWIKLSVLLCIFQLTPVFAGCPAGMNDYQGFCCPAPSIGNHGDGKCYCPDGSIYAQTQCHTPSGSSSSSAPITCPAGNDVVGTQCVCKPGLHRISTSGICGCPVGEQLVNGQCTLAPCPPGSARLQGNGNTCVVMGGSSSGSSTLPPCPPGSARLQGNGNTCVVMGGGSSGGGSSGGGSSGGGSSGGGSSGGGSSGGGSSGGGSSSGSHQCPTGQTYSVQAATCLLAQPGDRPLCVGLYSAAIGAGTESAKQWVSVEHGFVPTPDGIKPDTLRARASGQAQWEMFYVTDLSGNPIMSSLEKYGATSLDVADAKDLESLPHFALKSYATNKFVRFVQVDGTKGYFIADGQASDPAASFRVNNNKVNDNGDGYTTIAGKMYKDVLWSDVGGWVFASSTSKYPYVVQGDRNFPITVPGSTTPNYNFSVITIKPSIGNCNTFFWKPGSGTNNGENFGYPTK